MRYVPQLDGLRALAVLAVLAFHARVPGFSGGYFGVDLFFVLSGYLITTLLSEEHERSARIKLGAFYMRRLRRLYPALLFMLAAYLAAAPLLFGSGAHFRDAGLAALYLTDYSVALLRFPVMLSHTWSLSVEEHFYLVWPVAMLALLKLSPGRRVPALLLLAAVATAWRWWVVEYTDPWTQPYYRFDTRLSGLLIGAAAAFYGKQLHPILCVVGLALLATAITNAEWRDSDGLQGWMLLAEAGAVLAIVGARRMPWLDAEWLAWLGQISYGIYLWHYPLMYWMRTNGFDWFATLLIGGTLSVLFAAISYETVERSYRLRRSHRVEGAGRTEVGALGRDPGVG